MGYRSKVAAMFYTEDKEQWPMLKLFVEENFPVNEFKGSIKEIDQTWLWGYEFREIGIKWETRFPEVAAFDAFVYKFEDLADVRDAENNYARNWAYEFIRIGEDDDDVERACSQQSYGLLDMSREIMIAYNNPPPQA